MGNITCPNCGSTESFRRSGLQEVGLIETVSDGGDTVDDFEITDFIRWTGTVTILCYACEHVWKLKS